MSWDAIWETILNSGPIIGILAVALLVGAAYEVWVWGYVHRRMIAHFESLVEHEREESTYWRNKAFTAYGIGEDISHVASQIVDEETSS